VNRSSVGALIASLRVLTRTANGLFLPFARPPERLRRRDAEQTAPKRSDALLKGFLQPRDELLEGSCQVLQVKPCGHFPVSNLGWPVGSELTA
jgi:hypothetical protein